MRDNIRDMAVYRIVLDQAASYVAALARRPYRSKREIDFVLEELGGLLERNRAVCDRHRAVENMRGDMRFVKVGDYYFASDKEAALAAKRKAAPEKAESAYWNMLERLRGVASRTVINGIVFDRCEFGELYGEMPLTAPEDRRESRGRALSAWRPGDGMPGLD